MDQYEKVIFGCEAMQKCDRIFYRRVGLHFIRSDEASAAQNFKPSPPGLTRSVMAGLSGHPRLGC